MKTITIDKNKIICPWCHGPCIGTGYFMQVGDQLWHSACYDTIAGLKAPTQDALNAAREAGAKWMREKAEQVCELKRVALIKAGGELLAWNECAYLRDEIHDLSVKP